MAGGKSGKDIGLLILRLALGGMMIAHGVRTLWPENKLGDLSTQLANLGLPAPHPLAMGIVAAGIVGGALVVLGLWAQIGALLIALAMGTMVFKDWANGFFVRNEWSGVSPRVEHGIELSLAYLAMALCILLVGPGAIAVLKKKKKEG
jgi:putative oxidoreductase